MHIISLHHLQVICRSRINWLTVYRSGKKGWCKDQSKPPQNSPKRISKIDKEQIVKNRQRLEAEKFAQLGASVMKRELIKYDFQFPSDRIINRVLNGEGLVEKTPNAHKGVQYLILVKHWITVPLARPLCLAFGISRARVGLTVINPFLS